MQNQCTARNTVDSPVLGMTNNYLRPKQVATWLNISLRQVRQWQAEGVIPFIKVGGTILFDPAKVRAALDRFERNSETSPTRKVKIGTDEVYAEYEEPKGLQ